MPWAPRPSPADAVGDTSRLAERGAVIGEDLLGTDLLAGLVTTSFVVAGLIDRADDLTMGFDFAAAIAGAGRLAEPADVVPFLRVPD